MRIRTVKPTGRYVVVGFLIDPEERRKLRLLAAQKDQTLSAYLRDLVREKVHGVEPKNVER